MWIHLYYIFFNLGHFISLSQFALMVYLPYPGLEELLCYYLHLLHDFGISSL